MNYVDKPYCTITNATWNPPGTIKVTFENGDTANFDVSLNPNLRWEKAVPSQDGSMLLVPDFRLIPWDEIRRQTDPAFKAIMVKAAERQAKQIGKRIKVLRLEKGMRAFDLASLVDITPKCLENIEEYGSLDDVALLWKLLAAMDCTPADLAEPKTN